MNEKYENNEEGEWVTVFKNPQFMNVGEDVRVLEESKEWVDGMDVTIGMIGKIKEKYENSCLVSLRNGKELIYDYWHVDGCIDSTKQIKEEN